MQPYRPLESSVEQEKRKHSAKSPSNPDVAGHAINSQSQMMQSRPLEVRDRPSQLQSVMASMRKGDGGSRIGEGELVEEAGRGRARGRSSKLLDPSTPEDNLKMRTLPTEQAFSSVYQKPHEGKSRYAETNLETLEGPYSSSLGMRPGGVHAKNLSSQDKFSLDRLNKNDPLATLDAIRRQDYQLVKAQELAITHKPIPQMTATLDG